MNEWAAVCIAIIVGGIAYSYWKQFSYAIVGSVTCVAVLAVTVVGSDASYYLYGDAFRSVAFRPSDLVSLDRGYTILTSMYAHAGFGHLLFNLIGLVFIGTILEQRLGTRPFILLYVFAGVCGTLLFAGLRWDDMFVSVVGASGAISGVLGALARLYPHERMTLFILFFPLPPLPIWVIATGYIFLQLLFVLGDSHIAVEAHIGGLVAGVIAVPYIARLRLKPRVRRTVSLGSLRRLARTQEQRTMLRMIEEEEIADVRSAWIEEYLSRARCPHCGARIKVTKDSIRCEKGHLI